jgi:hypothetical protein
MSFGATSVANTSNARDSETQKPPVCSNFIKPSDGLEPSTPSLPWRFRGVTRVHERSLAAQFFLEIAPNELSTMRREPSRVSFLMCPFCVRVLMPLEATGLMESPGNHPRMHAGSERGARLEG